MTLLLALLLASGGASAATDAGDAPRVVSVRHALLVGDDGRTYAVDGGCWLDDPTTLARAQDLERLSAENAALRQSPPTPPLVVVLVALAALGIGVGVGVWLPRP